MVIDSRNQPELETLSYKSEIKANNGSVRPKDRNKINPPEQPASAPPATLGMNSHVIKPEHSECEHNWLDRGFIVEKCSKCGALNTTQDTINKAEDAEQHIERHKIECVANMTGEENTCDCGVNQPNLKIIAEIEELLGKVSERLYELPVFTTTNSTVNEPLRLRNQALEEIDIFQKTTLLELRKVFE